MIDYVIPKRNVHTIIWHCSATPEGRKVSKTTITKWHKARRFKTIGYHYIVHLDGTVEPGRDIEQIGAHVKGHNQGSIGIVYIGGLDKKTKKPKDTRTKAQRIAMVDLTVAIAKDRRIKRIAGHNEFSNKACPCFHVSAESIGNIMGFHKGKRLPTWAPKRPKKIKAKQKEPGLNFWSWLSSFFSGGAK